MEGFQYLFFRAPRIRQTIYANMTENIDMIANITKKPDEVIEFILLHGLSM